jgi:hypothetical protein
VTLLAVGTCTIAADQAGSASYLAAAQVTRSFDVFAAGFALTVSRSGSGSGRVSSSPIGIDCAAACEWSFAPATIVTLTATAEAGSLFTGWSGACSGSSACQVTMDVARTVTAAFLDVAEVAAIPRLANISTRGQVQNRRQRDDRWLRHRGSAPKTVVVRVLGPSLAEYGVAGALPDPQLRLVRSADQATIASNDAWQSDVNAYLVQQNGYAPSRLVEPALYRTLAPGAYTAIVSGVGGSAGVVLLEIYEIDRPDVPLINLSTRGRVQTDFDVMIGGFIVQGNGPHTVVVRALGPSLANYGVAGALQNPQLQLVRMSDMTIIATNDDWVNASNSSLIQSSGFAPANSFESAILITLNPGAYTAIVSGVGGGTGVGLVEVYAQ